MRARTFLCTVSRHPICAWHAPVWAAHVVAAVVTLRQTQRAPGHRPARPAMEAGQAHNRRKRGANTMTHVPYCAGGGSLHIRRYQETTSEQAMRTRDRNPYSTPSVAVHRSSFALQPRSTRTGARESSMCLLPPDTTRCFN